MDYSINGYENENRFAEAINGKKIKELNIMLQNLVYSLYGVMDYDTTVNAYISYAKHKYDLVLIIKGKRKYISIKKGYKNSVHTEKLKTFIIFLRENNISEEVINDFLYMHYSDGTNNNSGTYRESMHCYRNKNQERIKKINKEFENEAFIKKCIDRFFITGVDKEATPIDALLYGSSDDFVFVLKKNIYQIIMSQAHYKAHYIHIAQLTIQNFCRNIDRKEKNEWRREYIQVRYYDLNIDIYRCLNVLNQVQINDLSLLKPKYNENKYVILHY